METKRLLCLLGGIILGASVFCPIVGVPIIGNFNYIDHWPFVAFLLCGAAIAAFLLVVLNAVRFAWAPGMIAFIIVAGTLFQYYARRIHLAEALGRGRIFGPFMRSLAGTIHLRWGLWAVVVGGVLVTIAAFLPVDELAGPPSLPRRA